MLSECVTAVPPGGEINWVTYYFRDRRLAEDLLRAAKRGVKVTVVLESRPRTPNANDAVINMLAGPQGLGKGFRAITQPGLPTPSGKLWKPHLHQKLYCFSHPRPVAYIGSFNPSGDTPEEEPDIIREIGDQDRGHNVLVAISDSTLVKCLLANARQIYRKRHAVFQRFSPHANQKCRGEDTEIYFWPRIGPHPVIKFLNRVAPDAHIR
ncbi:MAG: hypothetical protein KJO34_12980, partial [Deltaproteobacteria bacterium]|nr:hypothetical protein [Deltaproteobacteria bacterium]